MKNTARILLLLCLTLVSFSANCFWELDLGENFYQISEEIVSQHVKWAKPLPGGPIRTLFIGPRLGMREAVELVQRMDLDYDAVIVHSSSVLGHPTNRAIVKGANEADTIERLKEILQKDLDLIVIGNVHWGTLPEDIRSTIFDKINGGAGLLYVYPDKSFDDFFKANAASAAAANVNIDLIPTGHIANVPNAEALMDSIKMYRIGTGRIVTFSFPARGVCLTTDPLMPSYEYQQAIIARLAMKAAGREFIATDLNIKIQKNSLGLSASVEGLKNVRAEIIVRDEKDEVEFEKTAAISIKKGKLSSEIPLGVLKEGGHFCDVILRSDGGSLGFGSSYFETTSKVNVESLSTDKEFYEVGEVIKGVVKIGPKLKRGQSVVVSLKDNFKRVVWSGELSGRDGKFTFEIPLGRPLTILHNLYAEIRNDEGVLSQKVKEVPVAKRGLPDNFSFVGWGYASSISHLASIQSKHILELGLDTRSNCGFGKHDVYGMAKANQRSIPYSWLIEYWGAKGVSERTPCLTDPEYLRGEKERFHEKTKEMLPYGALGYTLGDETYYSLYYDAVCYSPSCRKHFMEFLQKDYGALGALNAEWKTDYQSWEELLDIKSLDDLPKTNVAPRGDHWRYSDWVMTQAHKFGKEKIHEIDPTALVGLDGSESLYASTGIYWYDLMNEIDMINVYPYCDWPQKSLNRHCVRSFLHEGMFSGMWFGGYTGQREEKFQRYYPWYCLMLGFNSAWWYDTKGPGEIHNALTDDFSAVESFQQASEEVLEIKSGIGKQIMLSERLDDKIAIHYSQRSFHVDSLLRDPVLERGPGNYQKSLAEFIQIVLDLGLQFNMVATEQIEAGELTDKGYKVLIMPCSQALTDKEVEVILQFVEDGGVVITDYLTGMRNGHLVPVTNWKFGELFGLKLPEIFGKELVNGRWVPTSAPRENIDMTHGIIKLDKEVDGLKPDLTLANRPSCSFLTWPGSSPEYLGHSNMVFKAGVVNKFGRGKAMYLNFPVEGYWEDRCLGRESDQHEFYRQVMKWAGVENQVGLTVDDKPVPATEIVRFNNGNETYIAVCKDPYIESEEGFQAEMKLPEKHFIYDMRRGEYLGETDNIDVRIEAGRAQMFAFLPYRIQSLELKLDLTRVAAGEKLKGDIEIDAKAGHIINVKVFGPDGIERKYYMQNIEADSGRAKFIFNSALNDDRGTWKLVARDAVTGLSIEENFIIE
jgi:glycosyl hydrolase family 42 (putative beta-galactosidase)